MKNLMVFLMLLSTSAQADWSEYTFLGTLNNVVFSYRTQEGANGEGTSVQFRVLNLNSMRARVRLSDISFNCHDGAIENPSDISFRMSGGEEKLVDPSHNVCAGLGGLENLNVLIDARVRR